MSNFIWSISAHLLANDNDIKEKAKEIKEKRDFIQNFDRNKNEYIEAIDEIKAFEKEELENQKKRYEEAVKKLKEKIDG